MQHELRFATRLGGALALALLLCLPAVAQNPRVSVQGHITSIVPQGPLYRVTLDNGTYSYSVPMSMALDRNIHVGDLVRLDGFASRGIVNVDNALLLANQPTTGTYNSANAVTGVVQSTNRRLNYVTIRNPDGRQVKVDVRRMDARRSLNVWNLRAGDRISANGSWENRDTFQANSVNAYNYQPMTSGYGTNVMTGVVQNVNRRLSYVTVRNEQSGQLVKVDVRRMDERQSVNVWNLHAGDRIVVDGGWENRDTFQATRVNF